MAIDKDKLNKLKLTHLSYMTDADRERTEVSKEGFTLDGVLVERVENLLKLVAEDKKEEKKVEAKPVEEEVPEVEAVDKSEEESEKKTPVKQTRKKKNS